jgi:hypothetical protein|tara:strand:- start:287 stop:574 length:288 start_codon:yes stop_codon:yes gene_type:complete
MALALKRIEKMIKSNCILACLSIFALGGCAYSIKEVDVSKAEPSCVKECSISYSSCVSQGNQIGLKTETLRACKEAFEICVATCPLKVDSNKLTK